MLVFLGYIHAHINWPRVRIMWKSVLPAHILYKLASYIKGNGRRWLARKNDTHVSGIAETPDQNNDRQSTTLGISPLDRNGNTNILKEYTLKPRIEQMVRHMHQDRRWGTYSGATVQENVHVDSDCGIFLKKKTSAPVRVRFS